MDIASDRLRFEPELDWAAIFALRVDEVLALGQTPEGDRLDLTLHGSITGPILNGTVPRCTAHVRVHDGGLARLFVRAPLCTRTGVIGELEVTGKLGFGGSWRAGTRDLPDAPLFGSARLLTGQRELARLHRLVCLISGELHTREARLDFDLFLLQGRSPDPVSGAHRSRPTT